MNRFSRTLSGALIGMLALCAAAPGQAAPLVDPPIASAVFLPGQTDATVQDVYYRRPFRPYYRGRVLRHRRIYPRRFRRPGPVYRAPGLIGRPGFAPAPLPYRRY